jgi:hypothetical protein
MMKIVDRLHELESELELIRKEISDLGDSRLHPSMTSQRINDLVVRKKTISEEVCRLRYMRGSGAEEV